MRLYQERIVSAAKDKKIIYLACKCGSGKTLMALQCAKEFRPTLIICPAFIAGIWENEIVKWFGKDVSYRTIPFLKEKLPVGVHYDFTIISYNKCTNVFLYKQLMSYPFKSVIIDEAHFLKNELSKRTEAILGDGIDIRLCTKKSVSKVVLLSGTPLEKPIHLFSVGVAFGLLPLIYRDKKSFGLRYCKAYRTPFGGWNYPGCENLEELISYFKGSFLTIDPKEIERQLPPLVHSLIKFKICEKLVRQEMDLAPSNLEELQNTIPRSAIAQLRVLMLIDKIPITIRYINNLVEEGTKKIVVFYHHRIFMEEAMKKVYGENYKLFILCGDIFPSARLKISEEFNASKKAIIFCSITAANVGLSLHAASDVIFAEISWSWSDNEQAFHRVWREGCNQASKIQVHWLSVKGSIDDWMIGTALKKKKVLDKFLKLIQRK